LLVEPSISLRECIARFGADPSRGIRIVMQCAHETSVRALCKRPTGPLHIVALGDSVMWGQGLNLWHKFADLVRRDLSSAYVRPKPSNVLEPYIFAHSGATLSGYVADKENLDPRPPGELPLGYPSIPKQLELAKHSLDPDEVGLVLLNGGINDVGALNILSGDPTIGPEWVREQTRQKMQPMRELLPQVLGAFTKAKVVIPNYFQIISTDTSLSLLSNLLLVYLGDGNPATLYVRNKLDKQSEAFNLEWTSQMGSIIEEQHMTRPELDPDRICLVDVQFSGTNAYGASDSYLWKIVQIGFDFVTQDGVEDARIRDCDDAEIHAWGQDVPGYCDEAAAFHPNVAGAYRYKDAIMGCIRSRGWLEEWRGGPWTPTYEEITASMEPPRDTPYERLSPWTGKIIATEVQPPHYPVSGTVVITRGDGQERRVPTNTEFSVTGFARTVIIDRQRYIQDDRVTVYAPYAKPFVLLTGGTHPMDL
jgi:lysophospholipase L1-like esterase